MLIENQQLNIEEFKSIFNDLSWYKLPRKLNQDHSEFFYIGKLDTPEKIIKITVRPSMCMQVEETFKNMTLEGLTPPANYKGRLCEWGTTVEVRIDNLLLDKVKEVSQEYEKRKTQFVSW